MKKTVRKIALIVIVIFTMGSCAQNKVVESKDKLVLKDIPKNETKLEMNKDTLALNIDNNIKEQKNKLSNEALSTIKKTEDLLHEVANGKTKDAINKAKVLIGELEVLLAKDPSLSLIPIDVQYERNEFAVDISIVREITKVAKEAMNKGYFCKASDLLKDLRSEMIINTFYIPAETYPQAIKQATILLEDNKNKEAQEILQRVLGTLVVKKTIIPLPILNAEQMIIEATKIDAKDHSNEDKVINLLNNAEYQLQLAEELGYGKRDKEYSVLAQSIKNLKTSVNGEKNSESKFKNLSKDIKKFKDRLFSKKKN